MFIAHVPAGFLLTRALKKRFATQKFLWIGLIASILPDLDLVYFYFIDHQQTLHHHYWTHLPVFWLILWIAVSIIALLVKQRSVLIASTIFFTNILLHLILDTFAGGINWLFPLFDRDIFLVTVPATQPFWILSFILHWSFLVELIIVTRAIVTLWYDHQTTKIAKQKLPV